jgi:hypothetical protein
LHLIEIFTYLPLTFVLENELLNVLSLNLQLFEGKGVIGDYTIIVFLMLTTPIFILWMIHFFRISDSRYKKFIVLLIFCSLLGTIETYILGSNKIKTKNWSIIYSMYHSFSISILILLFAAFYRKILNNEGIK